jgi:hypothetical protein
MTKKTYQKNAAQHQLHLSMLDALRNSTDGKFNSDMLYAEVRKRQIDPRLISYQSAGALIRSFAKAGYLALIPDEVHTSTRHGKNLVCVWKILAKNIPKTS